MRDAAITVMRQDYPNWELIIFDNASTLSCESVVKEFKDKRIKFKRVEDSLAVTDSWNTAINEAKGDYIVLLGDDDGLAPGYFTRALDLMKVFKNPDVLYCAMYQFFHPGVAPWERGGYVDEVHNGFFFKDRADAFPLSRPEALQAVRGSLELRRNFTFNMQAFLFSAAFLERMRLDGSVFHSPFPDYYLANVAMGLADKVIVDPRPSVVAGVSKLSFGFTLFNNLEERGSALLQTKLEEDEQYRLNKAKLLPGPAYNTNYIVTMEHVRRRLGSSYPAPNYERYRKLQIAGTLDRQHSRLRWMKSPEGAALWPRLSWSERLWATRCSLLQKDARRGVKGAAERLAQLSAEISPYGYQAIVARRDTGDFAFLPQLFSALETGPLACA